MLPDARSAGSESPSGPVSVRETAQSFIDQLKMKPPGRPKKSMDGSQTSDRGNSLSAGYLQSLPITELMAIAKLQDAEIADIDSHIYAATARHYFGTDMALSAPVLRCRFSTLLTHAPCCFICFCPFYSSSM